MSKGINYCHICGSKIPKEQIFPITQKVVSYPTIFAHWIYTDSKINDDDLYTCSHCGGYMEIGRKVPSYCPWCGASMCEVDYDG